MILRQAKVPNFVDWLIGRCGDADVDVALLFNDGESNGIIANSPENERNCGRTERNKLELLLSSENPVVDAACDRIIDV